MPKLRSDHEDVNRVMDVLKLPDDARALVTEIADIKGPEFAGSFLLDAVHDELEKEKR